MSQPIFRLSLSFTTLFALLATAPACASPSGPQHGTMGLSAPINGLVTATPSTANSWSLPICGRVGGAPTVLDEDLGFGAFRSGKELKGRVTLSDGNDKVSHRINELLDAALAQDPQTQVLDKAVAHYRGIPARVAAQAKDAMNFNIPYQGFGPSSEFADISLDEKIKLKSRGSAEYARQKHIDALHIKVTQGVMQVAMGLGMSDKARGEQVVATGLESLKGLVGEVETDKTLQTLTAWSKDVSVPESVYAQGVWDVKQRSEKFKSVIKSALDSDPVVEEITRRLHKYNQRSTFARVSAHVVETTLGIAAMGPEFIGAAGKAALTTFVMATGGPEQSKILKELYLDKRFESRWKALAEETHLALDNYHVAILTRNPVLLACAESVVKDMTGGETVSQVFGQSVLDFQHGPTGQSLVSTGSPKNY